MRWFKHYSDARHSEHLAKLKRDYGLEGYGRYWALIEFLCEKFDGECVNYRLPRETLRELFSIRSWNKLQSFTEYIGTIPGIVVRYSDNIYELSAPILLELQSRDFKKARKDRAVSAPKSKIKNKNKNKIKTPIVLGQTDDPSDSPSISQSDIFNAYNQILSKKLPGAKVLTATRKKHLTATCKNITDLETLKDWVEYFTTILGLPFLLGVNDRGWRADFDWLINTTNAVKVLEGRYNTLGGGSSVQAKQDKMVEMENPYSSEES